MRYEMKRQKGFSPDTSAPLSMTGSELVLQKLTAIEELLKQSRQAGMPTANDDRAYRLADKPLTFKEACTYLGYAPSYLYKLTYQKKIPHYKPTGKVIFFSKYELNEWVFKCRCENSEFRSEIEMEDNEGDPCQVEMFSKEKEEEERWIDFPLKSRRKADTSR